MTGLDSELNLFVKILKIQNLKKKIFIWFEKKKLIYIRSMREREREREIERDIERD